MAAVQKNRFAQFGPDRKKNTMYDIVGLLCNSVEFTLYEEIITGSKTHTCRGKFMVKKTDGKTESPEYGYVRITGSFFITPTSPTN